MWLAAEGWRLTRSAQILRRAEVQADDDGFGRMDPPGFSHLFLCTSEKHDPRVRLSGSGDPAWSCSPYIQNVGVYV